ncbi:hypothetical protein ABT337_18265 [Saccharopolyspora hirsuta]|uniref:hypothetical protein n=1 Tax=Saccharopolyspora hirsuta TaxID=1837 RepID=UPI00331E1F0A
MPGGRWGVGGKTTDSAVAVAFGVRAGLFDRPDAQEITAQLGAGITNAIADVLGEDVRAGTTVELIASPAERTFTGGQRAQ